MDDTLTESLKEFVKYKKDDEWRDEHLHGEIPCVDDAAPSPSSLCKDSLSARTISLLAIGQEA